MNAVQWGCRIVCSHPECKRHVDVWSDQGTPPLPFAGAPTSGPLSGWFLQYLNGVDYRPVSYRQGHVAFCPEHSPQAVTWMAEFRAWDVERSTIAKGAQRPLLERIAEWISPTEKRRAFNMAAYDAVRKWTATHPAPIPPWSKYASVYS